MASSNTDLVGKAERHLITARRQYKSWFPTQFPLTCEKRCPLLLPGRDGTSGTWKWFLLTPQWKRPHNYRTIMLTFHQAFSDIIPMERERVPCYCHWKSKLPMWSVMTGAAEGWEMEASLLVGRDDVLSSLLGLLWNHHNGGFGVPPCSFTRVWV